MTSKKRATELWDELATGFATIERVLPQIIAEKAWEPLGYKTFAEAWADRLKGYRLASDYMRAQVVYQMFDEGLTNAEVVRSSGVSDQRVERIREQHEQAIPPVAVTTMVRRHERRLPEAPSRVHITLTPQEREQFDELCDRLGYKLDEIAAEALRDRMRVLQSATMRVA